VQSADLTPHKHRVLIVEDHPIVRHGLAMLIDNQADLCVTGQAENVDQTMVEAEKLNNDVALVDLALGEQSGLDLIGRLHALAPARPRIWRRK
jgi:two-component system nitrate/nitrite response regulator NarL